MTDALIDRLAADLKPVPPKALERRIAVAVALGVIATLVGVYFVLGLTMSRPFAAAWGSGMFWIKPLYALAFGLLGLAAVPVLTRPDGRLFWPLIAAGGLMILALGIGGMLWMRADWNMPMLMGATALICPWLILLTSLPILGSLLVAMRPLAPSSPTLAGLAAGLLSGGLGAAIYALYCAETGMMFMAVWYSLGIVLTVALGAILGRSLLRW